MSLLHYTDGHKATSTSQTCVMVLHSSRICVRACGSSICHLGTFDQTSPFLARFHSQWTQIMSRSMPSRGTPSFSGVPVGVGSPRLHYKCTRVPEVLKRAGPCVSFCAQLLSNLHPGGALFQNLRGHSGHWGCSWLSGWDSTLGSRISEAVRGPSGHS